MSDKKTKETAKTSAVSLPNKKKAEEVAVLCSTLKEKVEKLTGTNGTEDTKNDNNPDLDKITLPQTDNKKELDNGIPNPTIKERRMRRKNGSGSVYPIGSNKWGYCLQLGKAPDGFRLRHLETANSLEEIEIKLKMAIEVKEELRQIHLIKRGYNILNQSDTPLQKDTQNK